MHSSFFVSLLALASFCSASPLARRDFAADEVILLDGKGNAQVMTLAEYEATLKKMKRQESMLTTPSPAKNPFRRRGCQESSETQVLTDETIIHDDVVMSPVLQNTADGAVARVTVAAGYTIGNSITTTVESGIPEIGFSLSIAVTEEWSTSQDQSITFEVPSGKYGLIVSEPSVRRRTGKYYSGCTDSPDVADFTADEFTSQTYGKLSWVSGLIRLCTSDTYPVPYCVGDGEHR